MGRRVAEIQGELKSLEGGAKSTMNISNCREGPSGGDKYGGRDFTKVTPNVKSNIIHTEAYLRVMDQLSDYLKNNPGVHQLRIWLNEMKTKVVETAKGKVRARGPFRIPISLEEVSTWMKEWSLTRKFSGVGPNLRN